MMLLVFSPLPCNAMIAVYRLLCWMDFDSFLNVVVAFGEIESPINKVFYKLKLKHFAVKAL